MPASHAKAKAATKTAKAKNPRWGTTADEKPTLKIAAFSAEGQGEIGSEKGGDETPEERQTNQPQGKLHIPKCLLPSAGKKKKPEKWV